MFGNPSGGSRGNKPPRKQAATLALPDSATVMRAAFSMYRFAVWGVSLQR